MTLWIFINDSQMANNLMKWWRTKFLNGYKQISVECSNGKLSDTEELLERLSCEDTANERLRPSCTTPPMQPQRQQTPSNYSDTSRINLNVNNNSPPRESPVHHHLNIEEFSCDVSLEDNADAKPGQEKQEFSFTLYDFDGHGKITKDDIAGLVTTIYEALGSSVKVPHYGSKTIKVKLTVSPDQRKHMSATVINEKTKDNESTSQNTSDVRYKRDLNVTIRQGSKGNRRHCRRRARDDSTKIHHCCKRHEEELEEKHFCVSDDSDVCSRVSGNISSDEANEEGECSDSEVKRKPKQKKHVKNNTQRYTIPNVFKETNVQDNCPKIKGLKKRSGSLQRQELLEIIQANMDKNNLSFQAARKQCTNHVSTETKQIFPNETKQQKNYQKSPTKVAQPLHYLANMVDPAHFYVDLASLQNITQLPQSPCQYGKLVDAVMCVSNERNLTKPQRCRKHNKAKSLDFSNIPFGYQLFDYPVVNDENSMYKGNKRVQKKQEQDENKRNNAKKCPQVVLGHTSSPHHLRHRNRQEDQARAMAQVVHWLEQEFSSSTKSKEKRDKKANSPNQEKCGNSPPSTGSVERHEHHHVHEHIHHHYHHYQESPIVV